VLRRPLGARSPWRRPDHASRRGAGRSLRRESGRAESPPGAVRSDACFAQGAVRTKVPALGGARAKAATGLHDRVSGIAATSATESRWPLQALCLPPWVVASSVCRPGFRAEQGGAARRVHARRGNEASSVHSATGAESIRRGRRTRRAGMRRQSAPVVQRSCRSRDITRLLLLGACAMTDLSACAA
jgi:hypothetical protein